MTHLYKCIVGPKLFRIYSLDQKLSSESVPIDGYQSNKAEHFGNRILQCISVFWNIGLYTSPFIAFYLHRRNYFCVTGCVSLGKLATGIGILLAIGYIIRGFGRYFNPAYGTFIKDLEEAQKTATMGSYVVQLPANNKRLLTSSYDFEFWAASRSFSARSNKPFTQTGTPSEFGLIKKILCAPLDVASYFLMHLFGRHLIYPGSVHLLQFLMGNMLEQGREKLITENQGKRNKILTIDGNDIDTIFIDRRKTNHLFGSTLVVCCEGNAGFYEVGTVAVPIEAGYSVLGWNHPGFGGSTGLPFPSQDQAAVDAVMQFAIYSLGFQPQEIVIYAWSIGGYSASWAAMNYPEIRGLVLDATFDDILPLAIPRMPGFMSGLVKRAIPQFMNLNVAEQLCKYPGPVTIIRRTLDEIITTTEGDIKSNRGNYLLLTLLKHRYPKLLDSNLASSTLVQWINQDSKIQADFTLEAIYANHHIDDQLCMTKLVSYIEENGESYPMLLGSDWTEEEKCQMIMFLAWNIFVNFDSSHNNPLHVSYFRAPWAPMADSSYVKV